MTIKILITGGAGFIGHHVVEHIYRNTDWHIIIIDKLTYASKGLDKLRNAELLNNDRVKVFTFDLINPITVGLKYEIGEVDYIIHMAADTHVDNSIKEPRDFVLNNIKNTLTMLEFARELKTLQKFFYFSTDEVFGSAHNNISYKENDRHNPTNPYSASKSAAEMICLSYENTYKLPIIITNMMNAFGQRAHPEKFLPKVINFILQDKILPIHSDKGCINPGSRFYIHSRNIAAAVMFLIENGNIGEKYNIIGEKEVDNLEFAKMIAKFIGKELKYKLVDFHSTRCGHDLRYALDGNKMKEMGWKLPVDFENSVKETVTWYLDNPEWLEFEYPKDEFN